MKKRLRKAFLAVILVVALLVSFAGVAMAADPTVPFTVTAAVAGATNSGGSWAGGLAEVDDVVYYSADGQQNDTYSTIENTGNVPIDVEFQGSDIEGGTYDWTLAATAGVEQFSMHANSEGTPTVYDVELKASSYVMLVSNLAASGTYTYSIKFVAPTAFNASDDGTEKSMTIDLVVSRYVP